MITQKPISLKIDTKLLENLDNECKRTWRKRNWHINQAISYYLEIRELRRICRDLGSNENNKKKEVLTKWLHNRIPEVANL